MNLTKFGSPHLDTPTSRYEFLKFAFKTVKTNQEKHSKYRLTTGTRGSMGPTRQRHTEQEHGLIGEKLADGEVTGDEVGINVFTILFRTYRYPLVGPTDHRSDLAGEHGGSAMEDLPSLVKM